jgi:anti-sigma regulatory factor (Ser/Thr protein kinase)
MLPVPNAPADPDIIARRWANDPRNVQRARDDLSVLLLKWDMPVGVMDSAVLVLSELFTNSLRHAREPQGRHIETRFERRRGGVRIEVHDANDGKPHRREASGDEECGRGLALVDVLTGGCWGVSEREGVGKVVWAECADDGLA